MKFGARSPGFGAEGAAIVVWPNVSASAVRSRRDQEGEIKADGLMMKVRSRLFPCRRAKANGYYMAGRMWTRLKSNLCGFSPAQVY